MCLVSTVTQHLHDPSPFQMSKVTFKLGIRRMEDTFSESSEEDGLSCTSPELEQCQMWKLEAAKTAKPRIMGTRAARTLRKASLQSTLDPLQCQWVEMKLGQHLGQNMLQNVSNPRQYLPCSSDISPWPFTFQNVKGQKLVWGWWNTNMFSESSEEDGLSRTSP